jgi:hypothetical protein
MKRKQLLFAAVVVLLLGLNVWRWLPVSTEAATVRTHRATLSTDELALRVTSIATDSGPPQRDLFQAREAPAPRPQARTVVAKPEGPPPKSPEELAAEQLQAEFDSIKVVGIVFQDGVGQAFIAIGDSSEIVGVGDALKERFKVEAISDDAVDLRAIDGSVGGRVALTGS